MGTLIKKLEFSLENQWDIYRDYETTVTTFDDSGNTSVDLVVTFVDQNPETAYLTIWVRNDYRPAEVAGTYSLPLDVAKGLVGN